MQMIKDLQRAISEALVNAESKGVEVCRVKGEGWAGEIDRRRRDGKRLGSRFHTTG